MTSSDAVTVEIDRLACMGTGTCVQTAPELFALGSDNRAHVVAEDIRDEELAVAAAESCPTFAITVRRGDDFLT